VIFDFLETLASGLKLLKSQPRGAGTLMVEKFVIFGGGGEFALTT